MVMRIGHPGHRRRAVQIDDARGRAFIVLRGCVRADEDYAVAFDGDSFRARLLFIRGVDVAVDKNEIGR